MIIQRLGDDINRELYKACTNHPMQSFEWGEARIKLGTEVIRFGEFEGETLKNVYQMTLHTIPHLPYRIGYIPKSTVPSKEFLTYIKDFGEKEKLIFVKFEPNAIVNSTTLHHEMHKDIPRPELHESPHPLFPKWTLQLNLQKSEDELMAQMKPKTRYNVRLAQKKGVYVEEVADKKGFELFWKLYEETTKRQKYHGQNKHYHQTIYESLGTNMAHILIAFYEGEPLAAFELFLYKDVLYYPYGGSSIKHRNFMAANLLMWESIRFGVKHQARIFDMWGSAPPEYKDNDPWAGFTRLKEGYGSEFVEFVGSYDFVINPHLYKLYNAMYAIRSKLLNI